MRFGVSPFSDPELLLGSAEVSESGMSLGKVEMVPVLERVKRLGFSHVEIIMDVRHLMAKESFEELLSDVVDGAKRLGLTISFHLSIYAVEPASWNERIRRASVETLVEEILMTCDANPELYVIHPTGPLAAEFSLFVPEDVGAFLARSFIPIVGRSLKEIIRETGIDSRKLALENDKFPFILLREVVEGLNTSVCLDTGHALAGVSGSSVDELYEAFRGRIAEIHLHDGVPKSEGRVPFRYHLPVGASGYDFKALLNRLKADGFSGPVVFEMGLEDARRSLLYLTG